MPEVKFVEKTTQYEPGFNIGIMLGRKETKGEVGIEIEIEGKRLPHQSDTPLPWKYKVDHSLRGEENGEYILHKPLMFSEVPAALKTLWDVFDVMKSSFDDSNRTSVHVHLNCQEFHLNRVTAFMAMWFALEEPLTEWCGETRVGNLFCLRAVDAPAIISHLRKFIKSDGKYELYDILHYAGLNPNALHKFGSLEVRMLRGCSDPAVIQTWVDILERLYTFSANFPDPREVVAMFSSGGPLSYFDTLLGDKAAVVRAGLGWTNDQLAQSMFRGIRFAQDLCYCRDWSIFNPLEIKPDPFGRDSRKLAGKIAAVASNDSSPTAGAEIVGYEDEDEDEPDALDSVADVVSWGAPQNAISAMDAYISSMGAAYVPSSPPTPPTSNGDPFQFSSAWGSTDNN